MQRRPDPHARELMVDARRPEGIAAVERSLEGLREIPVDRSLQRAALATMRDLAATGSTAPIASRSPPSP